MNLRMLVIIFLLSVISLVVICFLIMSRKQTREEKYQLLREQLMKNENLAKFGVQNHGTSLDDVPKILVFTPAQLGLEEEIKYDKEKI